MARLRRRFWMAVLLMLGFAACRVSAGPTPAAPASLPAVKSRAEFDSLARVTDTPYRLPHLLFVIDRRNGNRVYYVNSHRYAYHRDFVNGTYLSLETGERFFEDNYLNPNRRFVMGTVAYQTPIQKWTFEFWEGDLIPADQIALAAKALGATFFVPLAFKPNSLRQEEASAALPGVVRVLPGDIPLSQDYQPLNLARAVGRIRILPKIDENTTIAPDDIVVAPSGPVTLPPIAGLITTQPSTPLSHINLRAKSLGLPNAYIRDAAALLKRYEGHWVVFETQPEQYLIGDRNAGRSSRPAKTGRPAPCADDAALRFVGHGVGGPERTAGRVGDCLRRKVRQSGRSPPCGAGRDAGSQWVYSPILALPAVSSGEWPIGSH